MNLATYLEKRKSLERQGPQFKNRCYQCFRTTTTCYCSLLKPFDPKISFVILIHPLEFKRRIATGRMSHLLLKNSHLLQGIDFSENKKLNELLSDNAYKSYVLFPGKKALSLEISENNKLVEKGRKLRIIVLDGTWSTAKTMLRLSKNLQSLEQVAFMPPRPSNFRVRKQPKLECFSTIEAIHHVIELAGIRQGFETQSRRHDHLLEVFNETVDRHIELNKKAQQSGQRTLRFRRRKSSEGLAK